mmetsp:Transcript_2247/g.3874  ORF Transcript_2247/g.3874 Transcript_2247/m.3874 type:complete len:527 (-) Transcript_2247:349-1929(-)|eukprot:CAMPEP_0197436830 /NCGR_PEP_ID=MMETSP1175-20131217/4204_1 /TAXON_ID=1003142 /ORGANISM="Triceratium dubium, Strain CCMP147" /LENGTH=526 /DNA_ID=CAMNT_0042966213 /DNA_START=179 /DNA_END=1759 /DNA_ORIENTATION=-
MMQEGRGHNPEFARALALFGGAMLHLVVGIKILWGNISPYVTSYLRQYSPELTAHKTLHVYTVTFLGQALTMYHGGQLEKKIGPRYTALFGVVLISGGTFFASYCTSLEAMIACQGVVGLGIGTAYSSPIICCFKHFTTNKGIVTGIITTGTGAGPFFFSLVATAFVNHENWPADEETGLYDPSTSPVPARVPGMFRLLACCYAVTGVIGASFLSDPVPFPDEADEEKGRATLQHKSSPSVKFSSTVDVHKAVEGANETTPMLHKNDVSIVPNYDDLLSMKLPNFSGLKSESASLKPRTPVKGHNRYGSSKKFTSTHSMTTSEMVKDSLCWLVIASAVCTGTIGFYIAATFKSFGHTNFSDDHFLTFVGSVGCLCSGLSRTVWGSLADHLGTFRTVEILAYISPLCLVIYTFTESQAAFGFLVCSLYALWGANYCLYPPIAAFLFGEANMGTNYGFIFFVFGVTSTLCIDLCGYTSASFKTLNLVFAAMGVVGGILSSRLRYLTTEVKDEVVLKHHRDTSSVGSIF